MLNARDRLNARLLAAITTGNIDEIKTCLNLGVNVNEIAEGRVYLPIMIAIDLDRLDIVRFLLENKASLEQKSKDGLTPLFFAIGAKKPAMVKVLLEKGADLSQICMDKTPLEKAQEMQQAEVIQIIASMQKELKKDASSSTIESKTNSTFQTEPSKPTANEVSELDKSIIAAAKKKKKNKNKKNKKKRSAEEKNNDLDLLLTGRVLKSFIDETRIDEFKAFLAKLSVEQVSPYISHAIKSKKLAFVQLLLDKKVDPNLIQENSSPLIRAVRLGSLEMVQLLLKHKANPTLLSLIITVRLGSLEMVQLLLKHKAKLTPLSSSSSSPLSIAVEEGRFEISRLLLENHADPNVLSNGISPYSKAMSKNDSKLSNLLLEFKATPIPLERSPLFLAVEAGNYETTQTLLQKKSDPNELFYNGGSPFFKAVSAENLDIIKLLLDHKTDPNQRFDSSSPLLNGVVMSNVEVIKLLLENKADPNLFSTAGNSPFSTAVADGQVESVKLMLEYHADPNQLSEGYTPLDLTVLYDNSVMSKLLLDNKANPNVLSLGRSTLYKAVSRNNIEIIRILLNYKAETTKLSSTGYSPLHAAVREGRVDIITLLLENKANPNEISDGNPLLVNAILKDQVEIINLLLDHNANPLSLTSEGFSPFFFAVNRNHLKICEILLENKANPNEICKGLSTFGIAARKGDLEMVKLLLNYKAETTQLSSPPPLYSAVESGKVEMVKMLLEKKADPNQQTVGFSTFEKAVNSSQMAMIELLMNYPITNKKPLLDAVKKGTITLSSAARSGSINLVNWLLEENKLESKTLMKQSEAIETGVLLNYAEESKHQKEVARLFSGLDNIKLNALHLAAFYGNLEVVKALIKAGFDPMNKAANDVSALSLATAMGHKETVDFLRPKISHIKAQEKIMRKSSRPAPIIPGKTIAQSENEENTDEPEIEKKAIPIILPKPTSLKDKKITQNLVKKLYSFAKSFQSNLPVPDEMLTAIKTIRLNQTLLTGTEAKKFLHSMQYLQKAIDVNKILDSATRHCLVRTIPKGFKNFSPPDILNLLQAFKELKFTSTELGVQNGLNKLLADVFNLEKSTFSAKDIHSILRYLIDFGFTQETLNTSSMLTPFLLNAINKCFAVREQVDEKNVENVFWDLAELGIKKDALKKEGSSIHLFNMFDKLSNPIPLFEALGFSASDFSEFKSSPIHPDLKSFDTQGLLDLTISLAKLKFTKKSLGRDLNRLVIQLFSTLNSSTDLAHFLPNALWALARLGFNKEDFATIRINNQTLGAHVSSLIQSAAPRLRGNGAAKLLWSLGVMGFKQDDSFYSDALLPCLNKINKLTQADEILARQVRQAQLWFDFKLESGCEVLIESTLLESKTPGSSELHRWVEELLQPMLNKEGLPQLENEHSVRNVYWIDINIPGYMAVEIDGPTHDENEATDNFKTATLEKLGFTVVRLSYADIDSIPGDDSQKKAGLKKILYERVIIPCKIIRDKNASLGISQAFFPPNLDSSSPSSVAPVLKKNDSRG